ncbi:MAG: hypothetical protein ACI915_000446 [Gammaproteobacteria bacterium]|jgi:hypothetical protein
MTRLINFSSPLALRRARLALRKRLRAAWNLPIS